MHKNSLISKCEKIVQKCDSSRNGEFPHLSHIYMVNYIGWRPACTHILIYFLNLRQLVCTQNSEQ